ncbi:glycosyltransferase family 2 protein [Oliverpabstia intestinalis]|uniref:glycosyltransferase family 2 protein n=1 Tax=Oliverpabstia intestinalis TaxID=2606633 RepID=UPI003F89517F
MENFIWNIDIAELEIKENIIYLLEGWISFDEETEFQLEVRGDYTKQIPSDIIYHERTDVREAYKERFIQKNPGFTLHINNIEDVIGKYQQVSLYVICKGEEKKLFTQDIRQIKQEYSKKTIVYNVENLDLWGTQMLIQGWVFDCVSDKEVDILLLDDQENTIKYRIDRIVRPDVNKGYQVKYTDCKVGFNITVKRSDFETEYLRIRFTNGVSYQEVSIDMKTFDAEHSKFGRLKATLQEKEENRRFIQKNGWKAFYEYLKCKMDPCYADYNMWIKVHSVSSRTLATQKKHRFEKEPLISIIIPLYNTPLNYLKELMDSLVQQSYKNIQICLADGSTQPEVGNFIKRKYGRDARVCYKKLKENRGISANTNEALAMATGDFIMLSDHDDIVTRDAVYEIVKVINENDDTDIVYTDEDKITMDGKNYFEPNMKPDFNLDFLRSSNYICHIFVVRKKIMEAIGGFRSEFDGAQDFDLILRCCEKARRIGHVPKVLYHWRSHPASTAENPDSKMYAFEAGRKALQEHYDRIGLDARAECTKIFGRYRTFYPVHGEPKVSIIIPNKDHIDDLKLCVESIINKSTYHNYEILIVENNSTEKETFAYYENLSKLQKKVRVITWKSGFNYAAINNYAVQNCDGEYLLFLNNDTEIITTDWLEQMIGICQRTDVGAVGTKLYFPDDTVQHAGVIIGMGGIAGHIFSGTPRAEYGYQARLVSMQDMTAVTAACMMVKRSVFEKVEGFDERYEVAFNDVDLCMKIGVAKKKIVFTPYVELYHYESKSRGKEETCAQIERFHREIALFERKWPEILKKGDPVYSVNLALDNGNCTLRRVDARS